MNVSEEIIFLQRCFADLLGNKSEKKKLKKLILDFARELKKSQDNFSILRFLNNVFPKTRFVIKYKKKKDGSKIIFKYHVFLSKKDAEQKLSKLIAHYLNFDFWMEKE